MNKISKFDIILFVIIAAIIGLTYFIVTFFENNKIVEKDFVPVDDHGLYFMVVNNINDFYFEIANDNRSKVLNLLDKNYIEKNAINVNNVFDYVNNYGSDVNVRPSKILYTSVDNNFIFYVHGILRQEGYSSNPKVLNNDFNMLMFLDTNNMAYSFYLMSDNDYQDIVKYIKKVSIFNNTHNNYNGAELIDSNAICSLYYSDFMYKIADNLNESYNIIADETKQKLFNTSRKYTEYITNNINKFGSAAVKCAVDGFDHKIYNVYDDNNNYFQFIELNVMDYRVNFKLYDE